MKNSYEILGVKILLLSKIMYLSEIRKSSCICIIEQLEAK